VRRLSKSQGCKWPRVLSAVASEVITVISMGGIGSPVVYAVGLGVAKRKRCNHEALSMVRIEGRRNPRSIRASHVVSMYLLRRTIFKAEERETIMRILLRQSEHKGTSCTIENVQYFEPLGDYIQFTRELDGKVKDVEEIEVRKSGDFIFESVTYDFCQVYAE